MDTDTSLRQRSRTALRLPSGRDVQYHALPSLHAAYPQLRRAPIALRVVLESLLRNCDDRRVLERHVHELACWAPHGDRDTEIPFVVGRIVLQDVAGIPLLGDLAAMRNAAQRSGIDPARVAPQVPVDMVVDHSIDVDFHGVPDAAVRNLALEVERNHERFGFVKWAVDAMPGVRLIPSGFGILHQVNLEFLARGMLENDGVVYPDTLVGTDSHSCMIAGLGIVGWGVGGIEAEAAMLGEPVSFAAPDVTGVHLTGALRPGVTSTDLVLFMTEFLRRAKVVGEFVEFFGDGAAALTVADRATLANMAPEYGATIGYFPFDEQSAAYLRETGRDPAWVEDVVAYLRAQGCFGMPLAKEIDYSRVLEVDLCTIGAAVAGPKRPQDRVPLAELGDAFVRAVTTPANEGGYGATQVRLRERASVTTEAYVPYDGDVLIAAITSCTNTSNPSVMLAAGLLARAAVERGLAPKPWVKTSMAPGSRAVTRYLEAAGLLEPLQTLGFGVVGYGCTTCVGNAGPLTPSIEAAVRTSGVVACAVLSGNRNFEARVHPALRAAYLASPPLVVAFALAGTTAVDLEHESLGQDRDGRPVFLRELWPSAETISEATRIATDPRFYRDVYGEELARGNPLWDALPALHGPLYPWDASSTFLREPPYFTDPALREPALRDIVDARALVILGDSVTTDHISPISNIAPDSTAGRYLMSLGVSRNQLSQFGVRRMNHDVMVRGGFGNVRLRNRMVSDREGPWTVHQPDGAVMSIFDAAMRYRDENTPTVVIAGEEYGTGSARDWAAKATRLLGVRAVIARSFERIHRSNLAGMGVLPLQWPADVSSESLALNGRERVSVLGFTEDVSCGATLRLVIVDEAGGTREVSVILRLDTPVEIEYARRGGILPYVLEAITRRSA
ncbi:MAG: aconitate hydratase AcnA [Pseudomonadota bacterium]|nr:aconitate hydratase AcnA [Pseudomonadota bacterium]